MGPKKKGGFFKKIQAKAKSGRGGGDPAADFTDIIEKCYDGLKEAYDAEPDA